MKRNHCIILFLIAIVSVSAHGVGIASYTRMTVVPGEGATGPERKAAQLLLERMGKAGAAEAHIAAAAGVSTDTLTVYLGTPARHGALAALCGEARLAIPTKTDPGQEGFVLQTFTGRGGAAVLLAAGVDERGVLYAVGEILRRAVNRGTHFDFPAALGIRTAPAFRYRGTEVSQGATITELTHSRPWTDREWQQAVLDYALAGANTFGAGHTSASGFDQYAFVKSYGLNTFTNIGPNVGSGPPEWQAMEAIGRPNYLCLSIPEARQSILDNWDKQAENFDYDIARFYSGDGGGCECDKCRPYGKKYIEMCGDIANKILKHHPDVVFFATNQKLDNAGDQAIFDYLNAEPRPWLKAIAFGPGSNAMGWQPGRRQDHRMDLFAYPAFGPWDRYPREIIHQLPAMQSLVFFTDLTHWVYAEYGLVHIFYGPDRDGNEPPHWGHWMYEQHPDDAMYQVYDRRTFHVRPAAFYRIFQDTMRYGEGDVTYSEGHHDQFNQWMWQRLMWDPQMTLDQVLDEYGRLFFGPEAAPVMAHALLQFEQNLSTPIAANDGIDRYYELLKDAAKKMPECRMKNNYLWRQHMQRAALDKYIQLRLREQTRREHDIEHIINAGIQKNSLDAVVQKVREKLDADIETGDMKKLKSEADILGGESDALFGVRNEGFFNLDQDLIGLKWIRKQVELASGAPIEKQRELLARIVRYEDPGEGGFYDDAGDPARSPHMVHGWQCSEDDVADTNRISQRTMAFTREEKQGVTFAYTGLDPAAAYRARFTFVRPRYLKRYADKQPQKTQSIYANDILLAKDVELPEWEADFFEYAIPREATRSGNLELRLEKAAGVGEGTPAQIEIWRNTGGWGTLVSEVWLIKEK